MGVWGERGDFPWEQLGQERRCDHHHQAFPISQRVLDRAGGQLPRQRLECVGKCDWWLRLRAGRRLTGTRVPLGTLRAWGPTRALPPVNSIAPKRLEAGAAPKARCGGGLRGHSHAGRLPPARVPGVRGLLAGGQGQSLVVACLPPAWRVGQKPQDLGVAPYPRFGNLKSSLKNRCFPSAVPFPLPAGPGGGSILLMHFQWPLCSARPSGWSCSAVLGAGPRVSPSPGRKYSLSIHLRVSPLSLFTWSYVTGLEVVEKHYFPVPTIPALQKCLNPPLGCFPWGRGAFAACPESRCS